MSVLLRLGAPLRRFGVCAAFLSVTVASTAQGTSGNLVIMQGLDKVTARVTRFEAPIGATVIFGPLRIVARACDRTPPEEPPESAAYLEIEEAHPGEAADTIFQGWMFASSPALSALEHPVYDVWVLECKVNASQ
ncbi:MAG: DUF2155 domain-containing protein [Alphaproteobacteria bacterium]|nr:DUF2155 domain-containing protein [Alphaproteobacteria bacterium]